MNDCQELPVVPDGIVIYTGPESFNGKLGTGEYVEPVGDAWKSNGRWTVQVVTQNGNRETILLHDLRSI
jgi:hypothetical protein